jgi:hypothetical protein
VYALESTQIIAGKQLGVNEGQSANPAYLSQREGNMLGFTVKGWHVKRYWRYVIAFLVATLAVKTYLGAQPPPVIGDAFQNDKSGNYIAHSVTVELRKRFPVGTPEKELVDRLDAEGFTEFTGNGSCGPITAQARQRVNRNYITCPFLNESRTRYYEWGPLFFYPNNKLGVGWAVDAHQRLVQIDGYVWRGGK